MAVPGCVWNPRAAREQSLPKSRRWHVRTARSDVPVSVSGRDATDVEDSLRMNLQQAKQELALRNEDNRRLRAAVTHLETKLAQRERELRDTVMCLRGDCPPPPHQEWLQEGTSSSKLRLQVHRLQRVAAAKQDHIDHLNRQSSLGFLREAREQAEEYRTEAKRLARCLVAATDGIVQPFQHLIDPGGDGLGQTGTDSGIIPPSCGHFRGSDGRLRDARASASTGRRRFSQISSGVVQPRSARHGLEESILNGEGCGNGASEVLTESIRGELSLASEEAVAEGRRLDLSPPWDAKSPAKSAHERSKVAAGADRHVTASRFTRHEPIAHRPSPTRGKLKPGASLITSPAAAVGGIRAATPPSRQKGSSVKSPGRALARAEHRASIGVCCSPVCSEGYSESKPRANSSSASVRLRARVKDSAAERSEALALHEESRRLRAAQARRARRIRVAQQQIARYRAERLRELDARLARRLRSKAPPDGDDLTRSWEEGDLQGYDGSVTGEGEDTDGKSRASSKQREKLVVVIATAKEEMFDDEGTNPVPSGTCQTLEQAGLSVDSVRSRDGIGSCRSGEGRGEYQDCSREKSREDVRKISPIEHLLGRPPLPPSHKHGSWSSDSSRHYSLRHDGNKGVGIGTSGPGVRKGDFYWNGPEGLDEVHTETACNDSGVALELWGDEGDDAFLPWGGNASPAAWEGRGGRAGRTFPMQAESSDHGQNERENDGDFPRWRTWVGRRCNVDSTKRGQVEWTTLENREDGDRVSIANGIYPCSDVVQAKQRHSPFSNRLRTVSTKAEAGLTRVAAVGTYSGGDMGGNIPGLLMARAPKTLGISHEVHGDFQRRRRDRQDRYTKYPLVWMGHPSDEVKSDGHCGVDQLPSHPSIAQDAQWCGPSELCEEQQVLADDEEAWKEEDDGIAPESKASDDLLDENGKRSGKKQEGPPTRNRGYEPRLAKDEPQTLDSTSALHRSRGSWGRPHEHRNRIDRIRWEAAPRAKADARTSREVIAPTSEAPRVGPLGTFSSSLKDYSSNVVDGGRNNLASSQSDGEADGFTTVLKAVGSPSPPSIAHVHPAAGDDDDEWIINEPPRKTFSKQKRSHRPHSTNKPVDLEPMRSPLTGIAEGSYVFDNVIIQAQTTRALDSESPVRPRKQVMAADDVQQHLSPLAADVGSASATRTAPRGVTDDRREQRSIKNIDGFNDDHRGNAALKDDQSLMAADEVPGRDGGETPRREQSVMGAGSTAKSDASSERCDPSPQSSGGCDDAKVSTTMQEACFGQHEGDGIVRREALHPDTSHAGKRVDLEGEGGERRVDSAESGPRPGGGNSLRAGLVGSSIDSALKDKELDFGADNDPALAVEMVAKSARENDGAENVLPESDRGETLTRGTESTPSSSTLVLYNKERSHMIGQAEAVATHIEDRQHLNGLDTPRNDERKHKHFVSAPSFPILSPDSEHTSVVDPQPAPMPELADRNIAGETSRRVNGDLGAEEQSSEDDYRLRFGSAGYGEIDDARAKEENDSEFSLEGGEEEPVDRREREEVEADVPQTSGSDYGLASTDISGRNGGNGDGSDIASPDDQDGYF